MLTFDDVWHFGEVFSSWMNPGFHCTGQMNRQRVWCCVGERCADVNIVDRCGPWWRVGLWYGQAYVMEPQVHF